MAIDATIGRRHANRAPDITPHFQGGHASGEGGAAAPRTPPRGPRHIPGVVRTPIDRAVRLPISQRDRDIGLPEETGPGTEHPGRDRAVDRGSIVLEVPHPGALGETGRQGGFLQGHGQAQQRGGVARGEARVGLLRLLTSTLERPHGNGVEGAIVGVNACDVHLHQCRWRKSRDGAVPPTSRWRCYSGR